MGLVDYSESESSGSEAEVATKTTSKAPSTSKKPFQKVVDRSNPGKIVVNLPQTTANAAKPANGDEPPAKRARTTGTGLFSGLNSFLPAPKNTSKAISKPPASKTTRPGIHLKTSSEPGFSYDRGDNADFSLENTSSKLAAQPSIPEGQIDAGDVKLTGKPLMFKPLSVARNPNKKKKTPKAANANPAQSSQTISAASGAANDKPPPQPLPPKKVSLFSMHSEEAADAEDLPKAGGTYEPMFETGAVTGDLANEYAQFAQSQTGPSVSTGAGAESLDSIVDDMNLSAAERRELFGRNGGHHGAKRVINFNMDQEYRHNEDIRAAGEQQIHNPVRGLHSGKHSLQKLVQNVRNQKDALEDSFAQGRNNRQEASSKYGWA